MRNANACYLRYRSSICPRGRRPVTMKVLDVDKISPYNIIVAVPSSARKAMHLHLDRETSKVYYIEPLEKLDFESRRKGRRLFGLDGEFITL